MSDDVSSVGIPPEGKPAEPTPVRKPWSRRLVRGLWNAMAVFGILAVIGTLGGLAYGLTHFSDMSGSDLSTVDPLDVPGMKQPAERLGAQLDLPTDYISGDIPAIKSIQETYSVPLATLSLRNPYERVLVYSGATEESLTLAKGELEVQDAPYTCDGPADEYLTPSKDLAPLLKASLHCSRALLPYEGKAADATEGHVVLLLFVNDGKSLLLQVTVSGNDEEASSKVTKLMDGFSWK